MAALLKHGDGLPQFQAAMRTIHNALCERYDIYYRLYQASGNPPEYNPVTTPLWSTSAPLGWKAMMIDRQQPGAFGVHSGTMQKSPEFKPTYGEIVSYLPAYSPGPVYSQSSIDWPYNKIGTWNWISGPVSMHNGMVGGNPWVNIDGSVYSSGAYTDSVMPPSAIYSSATIDYINALYEWVCGEKYFRIVPKYKSFPVDPADGYIKQGANRAAALAATPTPITRNAGITYQANFTPAAINFIGASQSPTQYGIHSYTIQGPKIHYLVSPITEMVHGVYYTSQYDDTYSLAECSIRTIRVTIAATCGNYGNGLYTGPQTSTLRVGETRSGECIDTEIKWVKDGIVQAQQSVTVSLPVHITGAGTIDVWVEWRGFDPASLDTFQQYVSVTSVELITDVSAILTHKSE